MNYKTQMLESFLRQYDLKEAFTNNLFDEDLDAYKSLMEDEYEEPLWRAILDAFVWCETKEGVDFWKTVNNLWFERVFDGFTAKDARSNFMYNKALLRFEEFKTIITGVSKEAWKSLCDDLYMGESELNLWSYGKGEHVEELIILMLMGDKVRREDVLYTLIDTEGMKKPVWKEIYKALCTTGVEESTDE